MLEQYGINVYGGVKVKFLKILLLEIMCEEVVRRPFGSTLVYVPRASIRWAVTVWAQSERSLGCNCMGPGRAFAGQ